HPSWRPSRWRSSGRQPFTHARINRPMNCQNCGAPMKLEPGRRYFICEYCTSLYFPEEGEDGLRVLGTQLETGCPVCRLPLVLAWIGDTEVGHCTRCRGSLLPQQS